MMDDTVDVIIKKQPFLFIFLQVVSSVSSRLHLNRLSRPDLSLADLSANWRRRVRVPHLAAPRVDWSVIGSRLRLGLSRVKVEVPAIKMPPIRSRRGWCGCFQKDEPPEITYCVVNQNGMMHLQTLSPAQPMPEETELDAKFTELLEELDLTPPNRAAMLALPAEKKWQIYCNRKKDPGQESDVSNPPEHYIAKVNSIAQLPFSEDDAEEMRIRTKLVDSLKTALRTQPHSFVQRFIELDGLPSLLGALGSMDELTAHCGLHNAYIGCVKALMNNSTGRAHVLAHPSSIKIIAQSLSADNPKVKMAVLEILGAVCLVPGGHRKVLEAMLHFQEYAGERTRFQTIVNDLDRSIGAYRDDVGLKTATMSFLNALLNYGPGEDNLEFRLHLRYELLMLGIQPAIDKLRAHENQTLDRHLDFFDMVRAEDERELARRYEEVHVDTKSATSMFECLRKKLTHTPAYPHFLSLLQHALLLPLDYGSHPYHWLMFDRIVQQLVLQGESSEDIDGAPLEINVKEIVQLLATEQELLAAQNKAEEFEKENCDLVNMLTLKEQELDLRLQEKEDCEAGLNRLKEKFERETVAHMEAKQKIADMETYLNELGQQLQMVQKDKMKLEHILNHSGTSIPDDAKNGFKDFSFSPPPGLANFMNGSKGFENSKMPPPPPPPPLAGPPPPPPPGFPCAIQPPKPVAKKDVPPSSVPLKCFNWTKIPDTKVAGTIWTELDEAKLYKVIDLGEFDKLFSAYQKNGLNNHEGSTEDLRQITTGKMKQRNLSVVDGRRAQNCTILLSKLKMTNEDIIRALLSMDSKEELPMDMVEQLLKFIPTNEERALLDERSSDLDSLSRADRFLYDVSKISHYEQRLNTLFYKKKFAQSVGEMEPKIVAVMEASKEVARSKKLKKLLEIILALGNYMNRGQRGNAVGFRISSLNRLADTKSSKNTTLLHYLVDILESKFKDVLKLHEDLPHLKQASKVSLVELEKEMNQLRSGLKAVEKELEYHRTQCQSTTAGDRFVPAVKEFMASATYRFSDLEDKFQDMKNRFEKVIGTLGDDPSTAQPDEVFGVFGVFLNSMAEARQENLAAKKRKDEEEKRLLQEADLRKRTIDRKTSKEAMLSRVSKGLTIGNGQNGGSNGCHVNGDKGEFDDLISALRAGDVFGEDLVKMRRNRRRANGSPHRISQTSNSSVRDSRENSRERALNRK
ncbi:hypothetical protein OUZ56_003040 [Daphnia magna]|uniref:Disheveled-associated activator of morphogenesis n=1 Tax=Daphnia magna TaxID=35525 RepID=A0ABR0A7J2_9CRUS|nr:hypothetical protein OUZ56_003040 [Daphnia magna]